MGALARRFFLYWRRVGRLVDEYDRHFRFSMEVAVIAVKLADAVEVVSISSLFQSGSGLPEFPKRWNPRG